AKRIVHTVKGLAGNIGCRSLQKASLSLEQAMETGQEAAVAERLRMFDKITMELSDNISQVLSDTANTGNNPILAQNNRGQSGTYLDTTACLAFLDRLEPVVKAGKPGLCKPILAEMEAVIWPDAVTIMVGDMVRQINRYKYKDAHKTLLDITKTLGGKEKSDES
ncbi:MAG TPA: hypothetical protein DCS88_04745, partial [Alphaproteobacteria bacterium]|nr:hypothetical protein [Alphaproteobacteria bacterium]